METVSAFLKQQWLTDLIVRFDFFQVICETLHFFGLTMLIGTVGLFDLRMLGVARAVPARSLHRLIPLGIGGFVLCLVTGWVFIAGDPFRDPSWYLTNLSFQLKMLFVALAGLNALLFYVTGIGKKVEALGAGEDAPTAAKVIAITSILLWIGVMYFGRMLPWQDALWMLFENPEDWG